MKTLEKIKQYAMYFGFACTVIVLLFMLFRSNQNRRIAEKELTETYELRIQHMQSILNNIKADNDSLLRNVALYEDSVLVLKHTEDSLNTKLDKIRTDLGTKLKDAKNQTVGQQYQNILNYINRL